MISMEQYFSMEQLDANLAALGDSPRAQGTVDMIVRRPAEGEREWVEQADFTIEDGLVGDNWKTRKYSKGSPDPYAQVTLMNSRVIQAITADQGMWAQAGDQLFIDFDLSAENLPAGTRLTIGSVILEVTHVPHTGCAQFTERFGHAALRFVNDNAIKHLNRRGINARVVQAGTIRVGDTISKTE